MSKEDYVNLHCLLAKLKYELEIEKLEVADIEYLTQLKRQTDAIDEIMKIFVIECD